MDCFVASGRPAGASRQARSMVLAADENLSRAGLLLEMAPQTEVGISSHEHFLVHRAVDRMTGRAALAHRFVLEDERAALGGVALGAGLVLRHQLCASSFYRRAFVGIMTITATDFSFKNRMVIRQIKFAALIQMALETGFGRFSGIEDRVSSSAALVVQTARPMARLATDVPGILSGSFQTGMGRSFEIPGDARMTLFTAFRAHKVSPWNLGRSDDRPLDSRAGDQHGGGQKA